MTISSSLQTPANIESLPVYFADLQSAWRKQKFRPSDLLDGKKGIVVVGAGNAGKALIAALQASDIAVFAVSDNDGAKWDTTISQLPVVSPSAAVSRFGQSAVFVVAIGRQGERIQRLLDQFSSLGAESVKSFIETIRFLPAIWPHFFLDPNVFSDRDIPSIVEAFKLLRDDKSRGLFCNHLGWRMTLAPEMLPNPTYDDQYFARDIVTLPDCAVFVDVGAYNGDTLVDLNKFTGGAFSKYYGFEPDPRTYKKFKARADEIAGTIKGHIFTENTALGASEKMIAFSSDGTPSSRSGAGDSLVPCKTLDSVGIENPTFVKVDVEGFEDEVLHGAVRTLKNAKPMVAIATYHRPKDLFEIPLTLAAMCPQFRFHLRYHGDAGTELDCYAVPKSAAEL